MGGRAGPHPHTLAPTQHTKKHEGPAPARQPRAPRGLPRRAARLPRLRHRPALHQERPVPVSFFVFARAVGGGGAAVGGASLTQTPSKQKTNTKKNIVSASTATTFCSSASPTSTPACARAARAWRLARCVSSSLSYNEAARMRALGARLANAAVARVLQRVCVRRAPFAPPCRSRHPASACAAS